MFTISALAISTEHDGHGPSLQNNYLHIMNINIEFE